MNNNNYQNSFIVYQNMIDSLIRVVNSIPYNIYSTSLNFSNSIGNRLQDLGDFYAGKNQPPSKDSVSIYEKHFQYIHKIWKTDPKKFKELENLVNYYNNTNNLQSKKNLIAIYFKVFDQIVQEETL